MANEFVMVKKATTKAPDGKQKHMALDGDLHQFILVQSTVENRGFREFGNRLIRIAIRQYIAENKLATKINPPKD